MVLDKAERAARQDASEFLQLAIGSLDGILEVEREPVDRTDPRTGNIIKAGTIIRKNE